MNWKSHLLKLKLNMTKTKQFQKVKSHFQINKIKN